MKMRKAPGKLMLGVGLTAAAAAVAMSPKLRNMITNRVNQMTDSNMDNYTTLH